MYSPLFRAIKRWIPRELLFADFILIITNFDYLYNGFALYFILVSFFIVCYDKKGNI